MKKTVVLIGFYNQKALGIRYLEKALEANGFNVVLVFFKGFNSVKPEEVTEEELDHLRRIIINEKPILVGLSVMTSLYLETVNRVNQMLKENFQIPIVWGGVFATLFPEKSLEKADFVIRGEGEAAIVELAKSLETDACYSNILNLAYREQSEVKMNQLRALEENLDKYGYPNIGGSNYFYIENDKVVQGDPELKSFSYELTASRGCPFVCSYCCSVNLHRTYKGKGNYVRFRTVDSVISELSEAKKKIKGLKVIHFWDEIFSDKDSWVEEFTKRYKKEINLPFEIWGHPLKIKEEVMRKLVKAGLYKIVVGIQSGSSYIRKEIFHRTETQEEIINASNILKACKVPQVIYDFMLRHPFETTETLKETFKLCMDLKPPFALQLHGLNFFPGSDIVDIALKRKVFDSKSVERLMDRTMKEHFETYWGKVENNIMDNFWHSMIYMTQFSAAKPLLKLIVKKAPSKYKVKGVIRMYRIVKIYARARYIMKKILVMFKSKIPKIKRFELKSN